ncbi:LysE family translocator [Aquabacterium sp. A7-Y]|uniref:LysE family translocator n=1 Tax=Aquabacterium sp. A7-Y TaxID=1349605 RepID=UPI00223CDCDA|nr:LysE family translocator [Aquabacterium sp. A7-Y]MCW7541697.1 LysE family translocator [Aquabacterium sp. A7-Y]
MDTLLPPLPLLTAFAGASLLLALTPGPAVLYIVARTLAQGRASGLASVCGVALGNLGNALGASLGLAALFALSSAAFTVVKWAGAAYLVWLGVQALRTPVGRDAAAPVASPGSHRQLFRDGFLVALLNPKTTLFFAAFLPQFMSAAAPAMPQALLLGTLFVLIAACSDICYVALAAALAPLLRARRGARGLGRWLAGGTYIGLGVLTALTGRSPAK